MNHVASASPWNSNVYTVSVPKVGMVHESAPAPRPHGPLSDGTLLARSST